MIVTNSNGKILHSKSIDIHDDILKKLIFDRLENNLYLLIEKYNIVNSQVNCIEYIVEFKNIVGFEMTSCNFWGQSQHILDFEYIDNSNRTLLPKLFVEKENSPSPHISTLDSNIEYIETVITFVSGDRLRMACEKIIIDNIKPQSSKQETGNGSKPLKK